MSLRPQVTVLLGAALAVGSMVAAYLVWASALTGPVTVVLYAVLALVGLTGALMTLRDLDHR